MKRSLALVLALVMVFGMMSFAASADFTDDSKIEYTEAVDVMSAIGVINGFENGSFDPAGTLTREQAAKVIAYMLLDAKNAEALKATSAPFADVAANRWSAGYIAYAVSEGIVNGRDGKNFDPTGTVTGYEFAKMLLVALGYDASIEQFTGASWAVNVAKTALKVDLFEGNDGANYNAPLTREEAALYAFNTLTADMVDYANRGTKIDLGNGTVITTGASKAETIANSTANDYRAAVVKKDTVLQFCERHFKDLKLAAAGSDAFDRPANQWRYNTKTVGTYASEPILTYTVGTKGGDIYADLGKPVSGTTYAYSVDGNEATALPTDFAFAAGNEKKIGGNGALIEIFEDGDNYIVTVINTYVAELATWKAATKSADEYVTLSDITNPGALVGSGKFETTAFTEDDADDEMVVIYTAAFNGTDYDVKSVVEAESATAFVSKSGADSFVAGGTTYKYSAKHDTTSKAAYVKDADDATIYLDSYGYAIYVDADAASQTNYAFVVDTGSEGASWDGGSAKYLAKIVLSTGEVVTVETKDDHTTGGSDALKGQIVTYTVSKKDVYTLTKAVAGDGEAFVSVTTANAAGLDLKKNTAKVTLGTGTTINTNNKTVFIVAEGKNTTDKDMKYTAYTGIANVPSMKNAKAACAFTDGGVAKYVYIMGAGSVSSASDVTYIVYDHKKFGDEISGADFDTYVELDAVVNGKIDTVKILADAAAKADANSAYGKIKAQRSTVSAGDPATATTYNFIAEGVTMNSDGLLTDIEAIGGTWKTYSAIVKAEDGVVKVNADYYTLSDDVKVFEVKNDGKLATKTVNAIRPTTGYGISVALDDDDYAVIVFLVQN